MSNTKNLLLDLIRSLYTSASEKYNLRFSPYSKNYYLKGGDGTFLGSFGSTYDSDSIFNRYGNYGSIYSSLSIFNRYGNYGSIYSSLSPYSKYTNSPPKIYDESDNFIGHLSANKYVTKPIDPNSLIVKAAYDLGYSDRIEELLRDY